MTQVAAHESAIRALGYTAREAAFLTCVARHSGYFVRRQFLEWIGRQRGQTVVDFTDRLVSRRHATVQTFCRTTRVYHLASQALFDGLDAGPSLRRRRPAVSIKARLMALDLVASRPEIVFFANEAERLAGCEAMGVSREHLPRQSVRAEGHLERSRYFPGGALIGAQQDVGGPVLTCVYIDDGASSTLAFQSYLRRYARLFAAVPRFQIVHAGVDARSAKAAAAIVRRAFGLELATPAQGASEGLDTVRDYFQLRQAYEAERWAALDTAKLDRFRALRLQFRTDLDPLYARWTRDGEAVFAQAERPRLETVVLPHSYAAIEGRRRRS